MGKLDYQFKSHNSIKDNFEGKKVNMYDTKYNNYFAVVIKYIYKNK